MESVLDSDTVTLGFCRSSAAARRLDFAMPAPPPAPLALESFEPQRMTSIMGSQAAAAASLRNEHRELELERIKLERARIKT